MRKGATNWGLILLFLVVLYFLAGGQIRIPTFAPPTAPEERVCPADISPDLTVLAYDIENPSTAVTTNGKGIYRKISPEKVQSWTVLTPGTEITDLEPFATYEFILGLSTTAATSKDYEYGPYFTITMGCQPDKTIEKPMYIAEEYDGLTGTFYNEARLFFLPVDHNQVSNVPPARRW